MQKYATRGQDDIGRNVPQPGVRLKRHRWKPAIPLPNATKVGRYPPERVHNVKVSPRRPGARPRKHAVSPEDRALFLEAIAGATPLSQRDRVPVPPRAPSPVHVPELPPEVALAVDSDGKRYSARAPGVSHAQIAELRAGKVHVEDTLDLHGATVEHGLAELRKFLLEARRIGRRCVLIVHGRGLHSDGGAPLREAVLAELLGPLSGLVHALASAAPAAGGEGATCVLLRSLR
jgi:DNA-nicking Smr family endonuclease